MKTCTKCGLEKAVSEFYREGSTSSGRRADCKDCTRARQRTSWGTKTPEQKNPKVPCVCGRPKSRYADRCRFCAAPPFDPENPTWRKDSKGYVVADDDAGGQIRQHRWVMERILGRPLLAHENVHHRNGVRDDNRPENLELWSTAQPSGQRVEDKIEWCLWFLAEYGR